MRWVIRLRMMFRAGRFIWECGGVWIGRGNMAGGGRYMGEVCEMDNKMKIKKGAGAGWGGSWFKGLHGGANLGVDGWNVVDGGIKYLGK